MANESELFRTSDDGTGAGVAPSERKEGDALASASETAVLTAKDLANDLQHIPHREPGDADSTASGVPGFAYQDDSLNLIRPTLDSDGRIRITSAAPGIPKAARATVAGVVTVATDIAVLVLTASKTHDCVKVNMTATKTTFWQLIQDDNSVETIIDSWITGSGQFTVNDLVDQGKLVVTSGSTGTQELILRGTQEQGTGNSTDLHARVSVLEKV